MMKQKYARDNNQPQLDILSPEEQNLIERMKNNYIDISNKVQAKRALLKKLKRRMTQKFQSKMSNLDLNVLSCLEEIKEVDDEDDKSPKAKARLTLKTPRKIESEKLIK